MPTLTAPQGQSGTPGRNSPTRAEPRTVYIIDDEELIRTSLQGLLRSMELDVLTFSSAEEFLEAPKATGPACLVLDVRLRGESGLAFQQSLANRGMAYMPVIIMTGHGDVAMTVQAMKAGAIDFLEKPFRQQDMIDAVIGALDADARRLGVERSLDALRSCWAELTPREREVLRHVAAGRMNKQIAGEMGIAEITAKIHRGQGMRKMRSRSVAELVLKMQTLDVIREAV